MYPNRYTFGLKVVPIWVLWGLCASIWLHGPFAYYSNPNPMPAPGASLELRLGLGVRFRYLTTKPLNPN